MLLFINKNTYYVYILTLLYIKKETFHSQRIVVRKQLWVRSTLIRGEVTWRVWNDENMCAKGDEGYGEEVKTRTTRDKE